MRDISLPNGVVICDGPAIVLLKADGGDGCDGGDGGDGRNRGDGCEVVAGGRNRGDKSGESEVVGVDGMVGVDGVVSGVDAAVIGVRPRPPRRPCGEVVGVDQSLMFSLFARLPPRR